MARALIVGCGYVGSALGERLLSEGHEVFGLRREASALPAGIQPLRGDVTRPEGIGALPKRIDWVVYAVGAKARDEGAYRSVYIDGLGNLLRVLGDEGQRPQRIVFTSSTSVYGQSRGEWVDERSPTHPRSFAGEIMLTAERLLLGSRFPSTVIRLGGIYGPGRASMIERVRSGQPMALEDAPHYTNRIHRDDAAGAIAHLLQLADPQPLYLGVDCEPADRGVVLRWLAARLGVRLQVSDTPAESRTASKRCRNRLLLESGYVFSHPTFREGYADLMRVSAGDGA